MERTRFGLDKMDAELVNDILPIGINLPKNQKNLLAILIHINGIDEKDNEGYFYVDNQYLMNVLEVSEPTLIANANKLISKGFIIRKSGKKHHPSKYLVTDLIKNLSGNTKELSGNTKELDKYTKDFSETNTKNLSKTIKNFSQDKEQDKDIDKEKEIDKEEILNIIKDNKDLINKILDKKENITYSNTKEKESYSSIESEKQSSINENKETKEIETMKELIDKLNERLNNCARQFKKMMQTEKENKSSIEELQRENNEMKQTIKELQLKVTELEAKQNNTSTNETSTKQEKSNSKPSNESAFSSTHQEDLKPTESKEMASTEIVDNNGTPKEEEKQTEAKKTDSTEVVEDVDVNEVMKVFTDVVKQYEEQQKERCNEGVLNTFKTYIFQDLDEKKVDNSKRKKVEERINNYINYYKGKSDLSPSNDSTLTVTHQEEEKPTVAQQMPLNEKKLRFLDTKTDKQYATEAEAQKDGVNPWFLYDFKVGRCITEYTNPSNVDDGIVAHAKEEKPTDSVSELSMAIVTDNATPKEEEKAVEEEKKHMYFKEVTTLTDEILNDLKKNYPTSEWPKLFKIDWTNNTIVSKTSRDIMGYGEESKELRDMIAMDSKEGKRLMKMVGVGV